MFKYKLIGGVSTAAAVSYLGYNGKIKTDAHTPARLIHDDEIKSVVTQHHGETLSTYFDSAELPSLGEDAHCTGIVGDYQCWGVFDGHSGWSASTHVSNHIVDYLQKAYSSQSSKFFGLSKRDVSHEEFDKVIVDAFLRLDSDMIQAPLNALRNANIEEAAKSLPVALNGSCAMMAFYNPLSHILKVAVTGDSRTVMGVQNSQGVWAAKNLSYDQTGETPSEVARIRSEHPLDPPEIVSRGRVLGYQPSRTFGDAVTKWTKDQQARLRQVFWSNGTNRLCLTPPYLTARPEIVTESIDPSRPTFIVMGCDGLYEWLTNKQVVSLVGQWLDENPVISAKPYRGTKDFSDDNSEKDFLRPRVLGWGPLQPCFKDENAATHLIHNALGGAEANKVSLLLSIPSPLSRRHRDDISCTVVFFNPEPKSKL